MRRRKLQRHAIAIRAPLHESVGELAFAGNFCRALVSMVLQQASEQNRTKFERDLLRKAANLRPLQIGKGRDEVEVPDRVQVSAP